MNVILSTRYNKRNILDTFVSIQLWKECIHIVSKYFETNIDNQDVLEKNYDVLSKSVVDEMDKWSCIPTNVRTKIKYYKPYYYEELTELWYGSTDSGRDFKLEHYLNW